MIDHSRCNRVVASGLVALATLGACRGGGGTTPCDDDRLDLNRVLAAAESLRADGWSTDTETLVRAAIRREMVRLRLLDAPLSRQERRLAATQERRATARECARVEMKRRLAALGDLEAEARARWNANPQAYSWPESFRLQMIFIPAGEADGRALARRILSEVTADRASFAELARRYSQSETAASGGFTKPMPGSAVHPSLRRAIGDHSDSDEPFLVEIDRGWYVARVVEFWPPVEGSWQEVAPAVMRRVGAQLLEETFAEISAEVAATYRVRIADELWRLPKVPVSKEVIAYDETALTAADILPGRDPDGSVPGPVLAQAVAEFRRWYEPALYFNCINDANTTDPSPETVAAMRLVPALREFVAEYLDSELESFVEIHREALYTPDRFVFDLWLLPFAGDDPYADLMRCQDQLDALCGSAGDGPFGEDVQLGSAFEDVDMTELELRSYDPAVLTALEALEPSQCSGVVRSNRLAACAVVRLDRREQGELLDPADERDRSTIVARYVDGSRDEVLELYGDFLESSCSVDPSFITRCVTELESRTGPPSAP